MGKKRLRPLAELDGAACRTLVGIVFDIDDTVTRHGLLEPEALRAMHDLAGDGLRLIAVTGRPIGWADVVARMWPVAVAIGENGAGWIWRNEESVREGYFVDEAARKEIQLRLDGVREAVARRMPHVKTSSDQWARRCDLAFDVGETVHLPPEEIDALVALIERQGARSSVSSVHAHAAFGEWDKASGTVRAAAEALGLDVAADRDRWLFIGDSSNDAPAFAYFPLSVGVRNVERFLAGLPVPPRYLTNADRGRGYAEMADHVLAARAAGRGGTPGVPDRL